MCTNPPAARVLVEQPACLRLWRRLNPVPGSRREFLLDLGPVMQRRGIEIGAIRPHQGASFGVEGDLIERRQISQRSEERTPQNGLKINALLRPIGKPYAEHIRSHDVEPCHAVNGMNHMAYLSGPITQRSNTQRLY